MNQTRPSSLFVFDELDELSALMHEGSANYQAAYPPEFRTKALKATSPWDIVDIYALAKIAQNAPHTVEGNLAFLALCEISIRILERTIDHDELVRLHPTDKFETKHSGLLRELGKPYLAKLVEDGLAIMTTTRPEHTATKGNNLTPKA